MQLLKKTGLWIFIGSLAIFILTLSLSTYKLTDPLVRKDITNKEQVKYFLFYGMDMLEKEYSSKFAFIADLNQAFENANNKIIEVYSITEPEITQILNLSGPLKYDTSKINNVIVPYDEVSTYKYKTLKENTAWIADRTYDSQENLRKDLMSKVNELNGYVGSKIGFDQGKIKHFTFLLTKHASGGILITQLKLWIWLSLMLGCVGALLHFFPKIKEGPPGIKNDGIFFHPATSVGWLGIVTGTGLILFYIALYWFPEYITNWIILVDPLSKFLSGNEASQWFLYGTLYCLAMLVMGFRMYTKYRGNNYQLIRTASVVFFQLSFAFLIPEILVRLNQPWVDLKNIWPLDYDFFFDINGLVTHPGGLGLFMFVWGVALIIIAVPLFTYFFGKRWYCSWVCGCGGLAETLGDPYRQLSDKSLKAWQIERWLIHGVLVFAVVMTGITLYTYFTGSWTVMGLQTGTVQKTYGFLIGSVFSGVVGTGFYPLMGNRVWCRFGCPLAAYLGLVQRFKSRFRITTNGGQCISCGNCSTYCEMGIDVRAYAQKGQNIVRSSCVGCGICSAVCPRGVLKLENGPNNENRVNENPILIGKNEIKLNI